MRKSTVFISAVLTTFALILLYGVASAYKDTAPEATVQPTLTPVPIETDIPTPTESILEAEAAAHLAAQVVGNSNLLSAESASIGGVNAYKITFTNNDVVYVGPDGQVLSVQVAPVVLNVAPPARPRNRDNGNNGSGGGGVASGEDR